MSARVVALFVVIALFGALSARALLEVGYLGLFTAQLQGWGTGQVLADLVIMGLLACLWMVPDAKQRGLSAWPFVLLTVTLGSFGPLFYLVLRELKRPRSA